MDFAALRGVRRIAPSRAGASSPGHQDFDASLEGELYTFPAVERRVLEGLGATVNVGAFSTPIVGGGAGTVILIDEPEGILSVPVGYTLIPLRIHVQTLAPLIAADADETEILIAADIASAWVGDGTVTDETPINMRSDMVAPGALTAASAVTGAITDPVLGLELDRSIRVADLQSAVGVAFVKHELLYEPKVPRLIVGPAAVYIYWGGTVATSGFAQADVLVVPTPPQV
jgi:hypothetical protein